MSAAADEMSDKDVQASEEPDLMGGQRYCYHLTPAMLSPDGYLPAVIVEGVPGHAPPSGDGHLTDPAYWGHDLAVAKRRVAEANAALGITTADARAILLSSITAAAALEVSSEAAG